MKKVFILLLSIFVFFTVGAQKIDAINNEVLFRDTSGSIVADSLNHNLGLVPMKNKTMVKYIKYIGDSVQHITKVWTTDPHIVCKFPKEPMQPGEKYIIGFCFWFEGREGPFYKQMGFFLENGEKVTFNFTGRVIPVKAEE